jgi:hypothetical protein
VTGGSRQEKARELLNRSGRARASRSASTTTIDHDAVCVRVSLQNHHHCSSSFTMTQESSSRFESEILTQPESESDDDLLEEPSPFAREPGQKKKAAVALKTVTQDSDQSSAPQSPVADERKALEERGKSDMCAC